MKKFYLSFFGILLLSASLFAQAPLKFNYQAVARDATGNLIANQNVAFRISILQGSSGGTLVYQETHAKTTNTYGQATLSIGAGTVVSGTFGSITWGNNSYYIKTEMDPAGGSAYSIMGTTQLLSVPYALYSNTTGGGYVAGAGINIAGTTISNAFPDQTVTLSPGPGIGTTGSYPNFTVSNLLPNAIHTGDATGDASLSVVKLQGKAVSAAAPTANQVLQWVGSQWTPSTLNIPVAGWSLTGNSGTSSVENFIGTTDNIPLTFKVNNEVSGKIDQLFNNTSLGYRALSSITTGLSNTAYGSYSLFANTAGNYNSAYGVTSLLNNTLGSLNAAYGSYSLYSNSTGSSNAAYGSNSLYTNTTGSFNTASGVEALKLNTTGNDNTAIGYKSLYNNIAGNYNTAIGDYSLYMNIIGSENNANGYASLYSNNTGNYNNADGPYALYSNTDGNSNTANGYQTLFNNSTGSNNTALGREAGKAISTGSNNILLGSQSGNNITTGSSNIVIGYNIAAPSSIANNQLIIGASDMLYGDIATKLIGIGTSAPSQKLELKDGNLLMSNSGTASELRFNEPFASGINYSAFKAQAQSADVTYTLPALAPTNGQILSSTNTGLLSWASISAAAWSLTGNSGTHDGIDFIGTTDQAPITFKVDNKLAGKIDQYNASLGYQALIANFLGTSNTALGVNALFGNTAGSSNTGIGYAALSSNKSNSRSTAIGYNAMFNADNRVPGRETFNTALGFEALKGSGVPANNTGQYNTAIGDQALFSNTSGISNSANGYNSLYNNTEGGNNTANGYQSLYNNTTGSFNSANGLFSLLHNTEGYYNTANGSYALNSNLTGNYNTANGHTSLNYNSTGSHNTAFGEASGYNISTGSNNILLGSQSGNNITTGSNNIVIGYNLAAPSSTADNQLVIGASDMLYGDIGTKLIGIGTSAPTQKLEIKNGNLLMSNSGIASELRFNEPLASGAANYTAFKAQAQTANLTYTLPASAPTDGQVLSSLNTGLLSWTSNAPDQTVVLNASTGISISSAYPNFTITNSSPNATHTGDATGGAALSVVKLLGRDLATTIPTDGQALKWNNTTSKWEPATDNNTTYTAGSGISLIGTVFANTLPNATHTGDATGGSVLSVVKLQGRDVANTLPTAGQTLKWNNTSSRWEPTNEDNTTSVIKDANNDTKVQVEETANEDKIHFDLGGTERWVMTGARLEPKNTGYSIFIGDSAGYSDDFTNNYSIFIGYGAGRYNTSGNYNTANGTRALYSNTIGNRNTAYGMWALRYNTTASQNTAIGSEALYTQSFNNGGAQWASDNVAIGYAALYKNQPFDASNGINNTATGNYALYSNTYGLENTANGKQSLYSNISGDFNTAIGMQALYSNTIADYNTATGYNALYANVGYDNTANGAFSLKNNSDGNDNTANGYNSLFTNTTGYQNTAVGRSSLYFNLTGSNNTALGYFAGLNGATHSQCTFIGSNSTLTTNRTNVTLLGYGIVDAQCTANNQVLLGNTALLAGGLRAQVTGITAYSDERFKTNIKNNVAGMDFILKLKPVTYNVSPKELHKIWGTPDSLVNKMDFSEAEKEVRIGFVAQDVEKAAKESGFDFPGIDVPQNDKEVYSLRYVDFIMPMVKGMQEQQAALDEQKALIQAQQQQIETLIKRIEQLENK